MPNKCGACGRFASTSDSVRCTKCLLFFHKQCVKVNSDDRLSKWQCRDCKSKVTSVRVTSISPPTSGGSGGPDGDRSELADVRVNSADRGRCESDELALNVKFIREQVTTIVNEMASFHNEFLKINKNLEELSNRVKDVENRVTVLEQRASDTNVHLESSKVEETLTELKCQINDRDQALFLTDVEITGVEEIKGENPLSIVSLIATKIGVSLDERDIVSAMRTGVRNYHENNTGIAKSRPRPLIVRLARRTVREQLLKAARVRRGADTAGLIVGAEPRKFYINERLTKTNRSLFYKVREEGRRRGWRYMWTRDGCIYARRDADAPRYRIRSDVDINKIFGV